MRRFARGLVAAFASLAVLVAGVHSVPADGAGFGFGFGFNKQANVAPTATFNFVSTETLDPRITFTRAGATATRVNSAGLIETVAANTPRFDYDPSVMAPTGANLVTNGDFSDGTTTAWALFNDAGNGTLTVTDGKLIVANNGAGTYSRAVQSLALSVGKSYRLAYDFTKISGNGYVRIGTAANGSSAGAIVGTTLGTTTAGSTTFTATAATMYLSLFVDSAVGANQASYDDITVYELAAAPRGLLIEEARTNKSTNWNANPTAATNVTKAGDAASVLSVVNDAAALAAAGLSGVAANGNVYKLDNSAGGTPAYANVAGGSGNVNAHAATAYVRGGTGTVGAELPANATAFAASATYARRQHVAAAPSATSNMFVRADAGQTVYFILNQFEEGAFATSVIPVAGAAVTRNADVATITGSNFASWYNPNEGTIFAEGSSFDTNPVAFPRYFQTDDGTGSNRVTMARSSGSNAVSFDVYNGGTVQAALAFSVAANATFKSAGAYKANDFAASTNGAAVATDTSGTPPVVDRGRLGASSGGSFLNGYIRSLRYYNRRLPDAQLQSLTK